MSTFVGKPPSKSTIKLHDAIKTTLPFGDQQDFDEVKKGFIYAPDPLKILGSDGTVIWELGSYNFLLNGQDFPSIHPSLQRQAVLNMSYGLFEVWPDKIYQVRGYDLSNMTLVKSDNGWIVLDVLTTTETAQAALALANERLGYRKVVAVVISHSHADHFGGIRGVVNEAQVIANDVKLIVPDGFVDAAVSENVLCGNAMSRRSDYQYGRQLPHHPYGHVDQAIGKYLPSGTTSFLQPNTIITEPFQTLPPIDGVEMVFQLTPGTEAPAEMNVYFPQFKAFWAAENIVATIHNIYTLRGALVRDALVWSKNIDKALNKFGGEAEVMFTAHTWPRWGNERIQQVMRTQRDAYAHLNNYVLHLANKGVTINEVHNIYQVPASLQKQWAAHSYHGSEAHNSRAVINRYLGYWDCNPATLLPLSPQDSAPLYVEMMGGSDNILAKGKELMRAGNYMLAIEILNKLAYAEPKNTIALNLLADAFEQVGYQKESSSVRNSFLAAARELRFGVPGKSASKTSADIIRATPTSMWLDYIGIQLDATKAEGMYFTISISTPDNGEKFVLTLSNCALTNIDGVDKPDADLVMSMNQPYLVALLLKQVTLDALVKAGKATVQGNTAIWTTLTNMLESFYPDFEIMPGTSNPSLAFPVIGKEQRRQFTKVLVPIIHDRLQLIILISVCLFICMAFFLL